MLGYALAVANGLFHRSDGFGGNERGSLLIRGGSCGQKGVAWRRRHCSTIPGVEVGLSLVWEGVLGFLGVARAISFMGR